MAATPPEEAHPPHENHGDRSEELEDALHQLFDDLALLDGAGGAAVRLSRLDHALLTAVHQQASLLVAQHNGAVSMEMFLAQEWGAGPRSVIVRALASVGHRDAFALEFREAAAQTRRFHSLGENATFRSVGLLVHARRFSAGIFKDMFGLSEGAVDLLEELTEARLGRGRTTDLLALGTRERLLIALLHLHNGGRGRLLGMACGASPDTVLRCLRDAETYLFSHPVLPLHFVPAGREDWRTLASLGFAKHVGVKCIILAVGCHKLGCKAPTDSSSRSTYFCGSKGPFVTMGYAVDDAQAPRFVMGGHPGSTGDMAVLRQSSLWQAMEDPTHYNHEFPEVPKDRVVIGDSAYVLRDWLMCPFVERSVELELCPLEMLAFNFFLCAARQKVEHFNGRLTEMCAPIRDRDQQLDPDVAVRMARTCAGLMSFGIQYDTLSQTGRLGRSVQACRVAGCFAPEGPALVRLDRTGGPVDEVEVREAGKTNRRRLATAWVTAKGRSVIVRMGPGKKPALFWFSMVLAQRSDGSLIDAIVAQRAALGLPAKYANVAGLAASAGHPVNDLARGAGPSSSAAATSSAAAHAAAAAGFVLSSRPDIGCHEAGASATAVSTLAAAPAPALAGLEVGLPESEVELDVAGVKAAAEDAEEDAAWDRFVEGVADAPAGAPTARSRRKRARPGRCAEFDEL